MPDMAFRQVNQRTNDRNPRSAEECFRMESMETAFIKQGKKQRLDGILPVVAEGQLIVSQIRTGVGQDGPAHFRTEGTGILSDNQK